VLLKIHPLTCYLVTLLNISVTYVPQESGISFQGKMIGWFKKNQ